MALPRLSSNHSATMSSARRARNACVLAATLAVLMSGATQAEDPGETDYRHAMQLASEGQLTAALEVFDRVIAASPNNPRYRYDYAVVLAWAQKDAQVLQLFIADELNTLPPYVLETIGKSARNVRRYDLAERAYRLATERDATRLPAKIGLGYALNENRKSVEAIRYLEPIVAEHPGDTTVLAALAAAQSGAERHLDAINSYERILALKPDDQNAKRARIFAASRLGATQRAYELALAEPTSVSDAERQSLALDQAALLLRWDTLPQAPGTPRYKETDEAIELLERTLNEIQGTDEASLALRRRARRDLVLAYHQRHRSTDAIATYETLKNESQPIPAYATLAAADAYLTARQPEKARELYQEVLTLDPNNLSAKMGVFYAYMDASEYDAALSWVDQVDGEQATGLPADRLSTQSAAALARAWTDDLGGAQQRLEQLVQRAPHNADLHEQLGAAYLNRGWPRAALDELAIARTIDPTALAPRLSESDARLRYADYVGSEQLLYESVREDAASPRVNRQRRAWQIHSMRELRVDASTGASTGANIGSDTWDVDAFLYSAPLRDHFRAYGHAHYAQATFIEGDADYTRVGAGVDYRSPSVEWNAELTTGPSPYSATGLLAAARWHIDDYWTIHGGADSYSNDVPLRGRLNEDVEGRSVDVGVDYEWHESRAASLSAQYINMSDDNRRTSVSAALYQRLMNRPRYKLDGWLRLYASDNTRENASYFNPDSDFSPSVTLRNDWLGWRRYERAFYHRLSLSAGTYRQTGYSSSALWLAAYEHNWWLSDRTEVLYGVSRSMHPYDGVDEFETRLFGSLVWKF